MRHALLSALLLALGLVLVGCLTGRRGGGGGDDDDSGPEDDDDAQPDDDDAQPDDDDVQPDDDDVQPDDDDVQPDDDDVQPDDDDVQPDDDDVQPDDDDATPPDGVTATGTVPCAYNTSVVGDVYVFPAAGDVTITIDTVSASTTFDPIGYSTVDTANYASIDFQGDDEIPCTFPPPTYACPSWTHTGATGPIAVVVMGYEGDCNSSGQGDYLLIVSGPGAPSSLVIAEDDYALPSR